MIIERRPNGQMKRMWCEARQCTRHTNYRAINLPGTVWKRAFPEDTDVPREFSAYVCGQHLSALRIYGTIHAVHLDGPGGLFR